ncbi:hypothetical protein FMF59_12170 [Salmonella enterica]|uniref:hypothetical protein n=1 Tax=Enterobacteriaceae TaxID=543 RepID=UPI0007886866|nr:MULTISPECIES: hypothetical protein [Enterobacteriaceae]EAP7464092.1 hypothetical protein [Salmonella enterica]EHO9031682.1 hypothetical protein [Salmonella enterica subsp. enterica serovar Typhimurium]EKN3529067.1 hypothetical protein [Yersinia enterocolitica]ECC0144393.1 hypothetical protein [Salmonella enterica]ECL8725048.1 hypothetical protein [Salmonella enterica]
MNKKDNTLLRLETALDRILCGEPKRILQSRKLSVRAVEVESGLGNGSAYYYPEIIEKITKIKQESNSPFAVSSPKNQQKKWKQKALEAERLKNKFRDENIALKTFNAQIAADQYKQMSSLRDALHHILELEKIIDRLNSELIETKRKNITLLK